MVDLSTEIASLTAAQAQIAVDIQTAHDAGFAEGVASVQVPAVDPSKVFAQADIDAAIAKTKADILAGIKTEEANLEKLAE